MMIDEVNLFSIFFLVFVIWYLSVFIFFVLVVEFRVGEVIGVG